MRNLFHSTTWGNHLFQHRTEQTNIFSMLKIFHSIMFIMITLLPIPGEIESVLMVDADDEERWYRGGRLDSPQTGTM